MILKSMMSKDDKMHNMGKKKYARDSINKYEWLLKSCSW
jgi:hypothetical protein